MHSPGFLPIGIGGLPCCVGKDVGGFFAVGNERVSGGASGQASGEARQPQYASVPIRVMGVELWNCLPRAEAPIRRSRSQVPAP